MSRTPGHSPTVSPILATPPRHMPLSELRDGDCATLHSADLHCDDCALLHAMGLTDRCELRVCRGGEPCIIMVNATRLGLAADVARRIFVTRHPPAGAVAD